ncbi:MAG: HAD family phosphatase [Pseudomonadota bacterium]
MIKAVLFDMDDVIVHSTPQHFEAYEKALKEFGVTSVKIPDDLRAKIYGMRISEIMQLFVDYFQMDVDFEALLARRNEYFMQLVAKGVEPMPGLDVILKNIEKWNLKKALATSGIQEYASEVLRQFKLTGYFDAIVTGDQIANPKPAPDTFLLAAKKLGMKPSECVVLEDATNGIIAAKKAGMRAIGIKNSVIETHQDLSQADVVVQNLGEINLPILSGD